ncbi:threonine/serine exporter family protein [Bacillus sp. FJAT-27445]|uniref:threonine/serine exporter family protein n=1 Tax=Bacillus sp. FJAT-27445 TaxID=1679166 RepID=UPI000743D009|nr:threonine/serine exporter family protein [Bacillus sp. FJAT-27445]
MEIIEQLIMSFIATAAFGILFNAPRNSLVKCGLVGMAGWIVYYLLEKYISNVVSATLTAAFVVGAISHLLAKQYRGPVIIFSVAGIIPLVPGGTFYNAMRHFVAIDYNSALSLAGRAFLISGAIAMGLVFSEVINHIYRRTSSLKK